MKHIYDAYAVLSIRFFIPANACLPLSHMPISGAFWFRCVNLPAPAAQIFLALCPLRLYNKHMERRLVTMREHLA